MSTKENQNNQLNLKLQTKRSKKISKGRADFHKLGVLLGKQLDEEKKKKNKYSH